MKNMKHIELFESFNSESKLQVGDIVFVKPTDSDVTFVAVDPIVAKTIEEFINDFDPGFESEPIKLKVTDPTKNYVVWEMLDPYATRLVDESEAYELNQTGDYVQSIFLKGGKLEWIEPSLPNHIKQEKQMKNSSDPKYIAPVVKNKIVFLHGQGEAMFINEPIDQFYSERRQF